MLLALSLWIAGFDCAKAQSTDEGRAIYERRCSVCHGDRGSRAFWAGNSLAPAPRDFTQTDADTLPREAMVDAVTNGRPGTAMTGWSSRLSAIQIAAVVDFIRAEFMPRQGGVVATSASAAPYPGGLAGDPARGGAFFHANCAECHGHAGDGRGRRAGMIVPKPLDFTTQNARLAFSRMRLFASISRGVPGTTMPAWSKVLTSQQIADVAEYVRRAFMEDRATKASAPPAEVGDAGKRVYLQYCSYCHGYDGDGRTAAAQVLNPKPRDFTSPPPLSIAKVADAVRHGRAGTAMPSFAKVLSREEIEAVAGHVTQGLAGRNRGNGRYHTAENGWPSHDERYGTAVPFALGDLAVDAPLSTLTAAQREGLDLFKGSCVSCHFGKRLKAPTGAGTLLQKPEHEEKGPHDIEPEVAHLTPKESMGRDLYRAACAQCHAADGSGQNWIGRFLHPSPADFSTPRFRTLVASGEFVERTMRPPEGTSMPSFERILSREEAEAIAAYVRRAFQAQQASR